jgi:heme/copper-type cytochrome/quinol oxidase subunit 2
LFVTRLEKIDELRYLTDREKAHNRHKELTLLIIFILVLASISSSTRKLSSFASDCQEPKEGKRLLIFCYTFVGFIALHVLIRMFKYCIFYARRRRTSRKENMVSTLAFSLIWYNPFIALLITGNVLVFHSTARICS